MSAANDIRARQQAREQVESIVTMVVALEVDYDRLEELRDEREEFMGRPGATRNEAMTEWRLSLWAVENPSNAAELKELEQAAGDCEDREEAERRIQEDPLSVEVRSGWTSAGETLTADEFRIVLCTGGPHVELVGDLSCGEPSRARVLYRDWGNSGELFDFDRDAVLTYCRQFVFV